jgi:hypothetical protein
MNDDLDSRLRDDLRNAPLPRAPETLRSFLANLPSSEHRSGSARRPRARLLVAAAAIVVLALALGTTMLIGSAPTTSSPVPTTSAPAPTANGGLRTFEVPGLKLDYPARWSDQTAVVDYPAAPGVRFVALLARGMEVCPLHNGSDVNPTPQPSSCQATAVAPGSAILSVIEYTHQYPWYDITGPSIEFAGYQAWEQTSDSSISWVIRSPDGGIYMAYLMAPPAELGTAATDARAILGSLRLSVWEPAPQVVDGRIHVELPQGFSFAYPAAWVVYYPQDRSMMDAAVATVASAPLAAPCASDQCQHFTTPPGTIAIEFRVGNGPSAPNWRDAPTAIGGQPAFRQDFGAPNATGADEGHSWSVRLTDPSVLGIYVGLRGPDLPALRAAMNDVLTSIHITRR